MDNHEFKLACQPWLRNALAELEKENTKGFYVSKEDEDLVNTEDKEDWNPPDFVRREVPNFDNIEVEFIERKGRLNEINKDLKKQSRVGLVVLGSDVSRNSKPSLIILTTDKKLYAIDGRYISKDNEDIDVGIRFLKLKLFDENINFWTTNGVNESDSLYHNYNIDLTQHNVNCCTGIHIHMMQTMRHRTIPGLLMYPIGAIKRCRYSPRIERFEDLVEIWLDIPREDFRFDQNQYAHLNKRPLNITAINIIKKRCVLVNSLIRTMNHYSWLELRIMSTNSFNRLTTCSGDIRQTMIRWMRRRHELAKTDVNYFTHLVAGKEL